MHFILIASWIGYRRTPGWSLFRESGAYTSLPGRAYTFASNHITTLACSSSWRDGGLNSVSEDDV